MRSKRSESSADLGVISFSDLNDAAIDLGDGDVFLTESSMVDPACCNLCWAGLLGGEIACESFGLLLLFCSNATKNCDERLQSNIT